MRTNDCTPAVTAGRLAKGEEFYEAATAIDTLVEGFDSAATLYIHAGIAAADVLCCRTLGRHAQGQDHGAAVALVEKVDRAASRHLGILLKYKTRAGYGSRPLSSTDYKRVQRAATHLIDLVGAG